MQRVYKTMWTLRAVAYKPLFGAFRLPGYLGKPVFLQGSRRIFLGRGVRIFPGLRAEVHGGGRIEIGEDVAIGQNLHITAMGVLRIGAGSRITQGVTITDMDHEYHQVGRRLGQQDVLYSQTSIGENCFIGTGSCLQAGTVLGDGCVVGANSVVRGEFPAYSVIVGAPGRVVRRYEPQLGSWERPHLAVPTDPPQKDERSPDV